MTRRRIMIFPQFSNVEVIERIRKQYDPLSDLIRPHITLVFPFESDLSDLELELMLERQLGDIHSFKICMEGIIKHKDRFGNYLFLNVVNGKENLQLIHDRLYAGELKTYDSREKYVPHMTVGKLNTFEELEEAYQNVKGLKDVFETVVNKISVEMIGENEESIIIIEKKLK